MCSFLIHVLFVVDVLRLIGWSERHPVSFCGSCLGRTHTTRIVALCPPSSAVLLTTCRWTVDTVPPNTIVDTGPNQEGRAPRPEEADPFLFFTFHCRYAYAPTVLSAFSGLSVVSSNFSSCCESKPFNVTMLAKALDHRLLR